MALQHDAVPARLSSSESEDRLRVALDAAGMGGGEWGPAARPISCGAPVRGVFRGDAAELPATLHRLLALIHPEDRPRISNEVRAAVKAPASQGGTFDADLRVTQPDGSHIWVAAQGQRFFDAEGRLARFVVVGRNITAGRLVQEESEA